MLDLIDILYVRRGLFLGLIITCGLIFYLLGRQVPQLIQGITSWITTPERGKGYRSIFEPYKNLLGIVTALTAAEITLILIPKQKWLYTGEVVMSLILALTASWLASRILRQFFDVYLLNAAFNSGRKLNSELLVVGKVVANAVILLVAVILFSTTHQINIFGLFASLGIGGLAVAFAAQKTLEQILGGVVILVDRPFTIDDYVGLSDGTFGKVEAIGLRSTKIRTSGKGTLMVVPNSSLAQNNIENFTGAKKVMSIIYFTFHRQISTEEEALIRQVIRESTDDIFGIDPRSTDISFLRNGNHGNGSNGSQPKTQAQCTFFILGSGSATMELRRQLLDVANRKIAQRLIDYDISFEIDDPTIYVDSPITI